METITYVIAPAANMVEIPLFAFPTPEQAHEFCRSLGLRGARRIGEGEYGEGEYEPILDSPVTSYHYAWQGGGIRFPSLGSSARRAATRGGRNSTHVSAIRRWTLLLRVWRGLPA